jgi:hypothetical protein
MNNYRDIYYIYDKPVPYKGLNIYPITMDKYLEFTYFSQCLLFEKNDFDASLSLEEKMKIISMTDLEYIYLKGDKSKIPLITMLMNLLSLCFKLKDEDKLKLDFDDNVKPIIIINDIVLNSSDFDEIKTIICEQNLVDLPDINVQKEVRDAMKQAKDYEQSLSGNKMASLEDLFICIITSTALNLEQIYGLTIRKFIKVLQRADIKLHYQIYKTASLSGMVTFKENSIKHWMSEIKPNKNDGLLDKEVVENKINKIQGGS